MARGKKSRSAKKVAKPKGQSASGARNPPLHNKLKTLKKYATIIRKDGRLTPAEQRNQFIATAPQLVDKEEDITEIKTYLDNKIVNAERDEYAASQHLQAEIADSAITPQQKENVLFTMGMINEEDFDRVSIYSDLLSSAVEFARTWNTRDHEDIALETWIKDGFIVRETRIRENARIHYRPVPAIADVANIVDDVNNLIREVFHPQL
jgi:hypothetical protein